MKSPIKGIVPTKNKIFESLFNFHLLYIRRISNDLAILIYVVSLLFSFIIFSRDPTIKFNFWVIFYKKKAHDENL